MADSNPDAASLAAAFAALKTYDAGSARASLLPLDRAVAAALDDPAACAQLETQLVAALETGGPAAAREYICSKLTLIGTATAVPTLAATLDDPRVATAARTALQAIPRTGASAALLQKLRAARGLAKVGIIQSLGARREPDAAGPLADCLKGADPQAAEAAAWALGEIGTAKAGRALRGYFERAPETLRRAMADALLVCAGRLRAQNLKADTDALLKPLLAPTLPKQIRQAAERLLR